MHWHFPENSLFGRDHGYPCSQVPPNVLQFAGVGGWGGGLRAVAVVGWVWTRSGLHKKNKPTHPNCPQPTPPPQPPKSPKSPKPPKSPISQNPQKSPKISKNPQKSPKIPKNPQKSPKIPKQTPPARKLRNLKRSIRWGPGPPKKQNAREAFRTFECRGGGVFLGIFLAIFGDFWGFLGFLGVFWGSFFSHSWTGLESWGWWVGVWNHGRKISPTERLAKGHNFSKPLSGRALGRVVYTKLQALLPPPSKHTRVRERESVWSPRSKECSMSCLLVFLSEVVWKHSVRRSPRATHVEWLRTQKGCKIVFLVLGGPLTQSSL